MLPTRGMVDLECNVGQTKVIMRKVVICAFGHQRFEFLFFKRVDVWLKNDSEKGP